MNLAVHLRVAGESIHTPGVVHNANETGLLINTLKDIPPGKKVVIEILFSQQGKSSHFKAVTEIAWKDIGLWDDWEGYLYGLKFIRILDGDHLKLKQILGKPLRLEETVSSDQPCQP